MNKTALASELLILSICGFWWFIAKDLPDFVLPTPTDVLMSITTMLTDLNTLSHVFVSMSRVLAAVFIAALISIVLAVLSRFHIFFDTVIENNILIVLNSFPSVGWAILGVIWFSISNGTVIFIEIMIITILFDQLPSGFSSNGSRTPRDGQKFFEKRPANFF